jgi:AcrR family transcriptional regulator
VARPQKHDHRTRAALIDAAEALLADGGPDAVTVRAVADHVGESTRAVYSQFPSMDGLMGALAGRGFRLLADQVASVPETSDPLADLVEVGLRAFRRFAIEQPHLFRITFYDVREEIARQADAFPALLAAYEGLTLRIQRAIDLGQLPVRPVEQYAFAFHSVSSGLAANELLRQPPPVGSNFWAMTAGLDMEDTWRLALRALVAGWGAQGQPAGKMPSARGSRRGGAKITKGSTT